MTTSPSILVVDDELDNFDVLARLLTASKITTRSNIHYAADGHEALRSLDRYQPDLILLDVMMPDLDGIEVCRRLKAMPQWQPVPVIMVTALVGKADLAQCLAAGADDFIGKPVHRVELNARVRSMLRIRQQYYELTTFNSRLELMVQQRTAELERLIFRDGLTQLPSRAFFLKAVADCLEQGAEAFAIVLLDCDQFQVVNGSFGNVIGDELLVAIAQRLQQFCGPQDLLARLGEDEFCLLLRGVSTIEALTPVLERLLGSFSSPFPITYGEFFMTVCAGVTWGGATTEQSPEALLQEADTAMYQAKRRGKGSWQVFDRAMHLALLQQLTLENDLQRSLDQQDFITYYQPIVELETGRVAGVEALVRWQHPERGLVPPDSFIPCMEGTGLVIRVGMMVLRQAAYRMHRWHTQGWPDLTLSVNLSVRQFSCASLLADIDAILAETGLDPRRLKFEITESAIMESATEAVKITDALRSRHIEISIDDFGTGYSSLGHLHQFSLDNLKIDRSFVDQIEKPNGRHSYVVNTIVALGQQLGLAVIAEGIETEAQIHYLRNLGCEYGQGFLFAKPLPAVEFEAQYLCPPSESMPSALTSVHRPRSTH